MFTLHVCSLFRPHGTAPKADIYVSRGESAFEHMLAENGPCKSAHQDIYTHFFASV